MKRSIAATSKPTMRLNPVFEAKKQRYTETILYALGICSMLLIAGLAEGLL